jgi:hypothetical protein
VLRCASSLVFPLKYHGDDAALEAGEWGTQRYEQISGEQSRRSGQRDVRYVPDNGHRQSIFLSLGRILVSALLEHPSTLFLGRTRRYVSVRLASISIGGSEEYKRLTTRRRHSPRGAIAGNQTLGMCLHYTVTDLGLISLSVWLVLPVGS